MQIRASQKEDITAIMRIYEKARAFRDQTGNPTQWGDGYAAAGSDRGGSAAGSQLCL